MAAKRTGRTGKGESAKRRLSSRYKWELRGAVMKHMMGVADSGDYATRVERARRHRAGMRAPTRTAADPHSALKPAIELVCRTEKSVKAVSGKNPAKGFSFGATGQFVKVEAKGAFQDATLRFRLESSNTRHLDPRTICVARWDERGGRFHALPQSGYNRELGYAYAHITQAGVYTAIGLPRDPRIRTTLKLMRNMSAWSGLDGTMGFMKSLCPVILCNAGMLKAVDELAGTGKGVLAQYGYTPNDFGGGYGGGNVCDQCLHGDGPFVEVDLTGAFEPEPYFEPEIPEIHWPDPCAKWESAGPDNVPGRITSLVAHPNDGRILYAGGADGGVYKTTDGGGRWEALWSQQLSLAIGGLAIAPSNPEMVYAVTGEWGLREDWSVLTTPGYYVYRTSDGGTHWDLVGSIWSSHTNAVAVDPTNAERIYVAGNQAVHRSATGGATWDVTGLSTTGVPNAFGVLDGTISDVAIDPGRPERVWAGVHDEGVWRSDDAGDTWARVQALPAGKAPRIAFGRAGEHGTAFIAVKVGARVFTSTDGGDHFDERAAVDDGWGDSYYAYCNVIAVHPEDENILTAGSVWAVRSADGGNTWDPQEHATPYHPDLHAIVHDPGDANHIYLATDGGVWETFDGGVGDTFESVEWRDRSTGLVTTQCYSVGVSQGAALAYGITTQDNSAYQWSGGNAFDFFPGISGEGGWVEYDPQNSDRVYIDVWWSPGTLHRLDTAGNESPRDLGIYTEDQIANYYNKGLAIAWNDTRLLLALKRSGSQLQNAVPVVRSEDRGDTWTDVLAIANVAIHVVKFAPSDDRHAYAASIDGHVWHSSDSGRSWTELDTAGLPDARVQDLEVDWRNPLRVYVGFGVYGVRHLWRGDLDASGNAAWYDASGPIPALGLPPSPVTGVALDPNFEDTIYVSNLLGVYRSTDAGDSWAPFDDGLPNCRITDLMVRKYDRSLYVSTFGRGVYRRFI